MENCTLVVTEKPDAASRIASALDEVGKPKRLWLNGVPYFEAQRGGRIVVFPALGHLYTVAAKAKGSGYPVFDYEWVPRFKAERNASRIRVWLQSLSKLAEGADAFVDACDYDIEGSIIGYCILRYACKGKESEAKRMKYSTLTSEELEKAYGKLLPHLDFALIEAGLTRHEVDWLYGINLSRALTSAAKKASGQYATLSTGRVQGPALRFLVARERRISGFLPSPFWTVTARIKVGRTVFELEHERKTFQSKPDAEAVVNACREKSGVVKKVEKQTFTLAPPFPFDLGSLQAEAYRLFGYTPMRTSSIAQRLYLDALISYPRTSSQKLPPSIGYEKILKSLTKVRDFANLATELMAKHLLTPTEGKKTDSAHPAVYPTSKLPEKDLVVAERNIWSLVVRRFLAVFGDPAAKQTVTVTVNIGGERFLTSSKQILEKGWMHFYQFAGHRKQMSKPSLEENQTVSVQDVVLEEKYTQPPTRYNQASLLKKMEANNIGTKATRAGVIQTLIERKYIQGEKTMQSTNLGCEVTDVLRKYCPSVVSVEFTRQLEEKMELVQEGKETKENILRDAVEILKPVLASLKENEKGIGNQLSVAVRQATLEEHVIGACPTCKTGRIVIIYSKKTGKRFAGCTKYFKGTCQTTYPLPQKGTVKPTGKTCGTCGTPNVNVWLRGKKPWNLCLNPVCSSKPPKKE